jgi:hypothetical protein
MAVLMRLLCSVQAGPQMAEVRRAVLLIILSLRTLRPSCRGRRTPGLWPHSLLQREALHVKDADDDDDASGACMKSIQSASSLKAIQPSATLYALRLDRLHMYDACVVPGSDCISF